MEVDVAIIGGGPAGATAGSLLKKYNPNLKVAIFERETFPRDHVGESQLPSISAILAEMGCWDKVEAAEFPIKVGATYKWGRTKELWDFDFLSGAPFQDEPRPARFQGQRTFTAFQVDRAIYDQILLDHAEEMGCEVYQNTKVARVTAKKDEVDSLELESGEKIVARHYLDASGAGGILRRALNVKCEYPTTLKNIAIWDYWQNAEWAVKIGVGGTRIQVMSLDHGWIWFIPLGPTRTSVGLVVPADHPKVTGKTTAELYKEAIEQEPSIAALLRNATPEGKLQATKDWSFLADRQAGENWFLIGESGGFADPILSAGLTLAQYGARDAAYTILELDRNKLNRAWLKEEFSTRQAHRIRTHIRFADYWYTANTQFKDLQAFTSQLAADRGLDLTPEKAWAWIAQGGFISEEGVAGTGGFSFLFLKQSTDFLADLNYSSPLELNNVFVLDLSGASYKERALYQNGGVEQDPCYVRGDRALPVTGPFEYAIHILQQRTKLPEIMALLSQERSRNETNPSMLALVRQFPEALEAMILDGWVAPSHDPSLPLYKLALKGGFCSWNTDNATFDR